MDRSHSRAQPVAASDALAAAKLCGYQPPTVRQEYPNRAARERKLLAAEIR
jgi:hypothetical protein